MRRERVEAGLVTSPVTGILNLDAQYVIYDRLNKQNIRSVGLGTKRHYDYAL